MFDEKQHLSGSMSITDDITMADCINFCCDDALRRIPAGYNITASFKDREVVWCYPPKPERVPDGWESQTIALMFSKDIEDQIDIFDFEEDYSCHTRQSLGELLVKQRDCDHIFYPVYEGDNPTGQRCEICGHQNWF